MYKITIEEQGIASKEEVGLLVEVLCRDFNNDLTALKVAGRVAIELYQLPKNIIGKVSISYLNGEVSVWLTIPNKEHESLVKGIIEAYYGWVFYVRT